MISADVQYMIDQMGEARDTGAQRVRKTLYIDIDGVLTNFSQAFFDYTDISTKTVHTDKSRYMDAWNRFVDHRQFEVLPRSVHFDEIMQLAAVAALKVNVCLLTSAGGSERYSEVTQQKKQWAAANDVPYTLIVVPRGSNKAAYCRTDVDNVRARDILIDDTLSNVQQFTSAGGIGILYDKQLITLIVDKVTMWVNYGV